MTSCPSSNVHLAPSVAEHPFRRQRKAGVLATLNSDDPGMMAMDLADEYVDVAAAFDFDLDAMEQISLDGVTPRSRQLNNKRPSGNGS